MTREEVVQILRQNNPGARSDDISMYADYFMDYKEAADNVAKNGNIVLHPRTGAPIENPYTKIKASSMNQLRKIGRLSNVGCLWE